MSISSSSSSSSMPDNEDNKNIVMTDSKFYLYTFPPVANVYSASPYALKIESILRLYNIKHEIKYTLYPGSKGTMPYARIVVVDDGSDGEEIADSNEMIEYIRNHYEQVPTKNNIDPVEHFVLRMIEEHTTQIGFYYRYVICSDKLNDILDVPKRYFKSDTSYLGYVFCKILPKLSSNYSRKKIKYRGLAQHTDDEKWKFCNLDLQAISDYLGDKEWFLGGKAPTIVDCMLFGHLAQLLYIPLDNFPQAEYLRSNCPNVVQYVDRFRDLIYPDWNVKCQPQDPDWSIKPNPSRKRSVNHGNKENRSYAVVPVFAAFLIGIASFVYAKKQRS